MVFYGGEPRLGTLEEQELGRGGRGEGGGWGGRRMGGSADERRFVGLFFYDGMKLVCLRRRAAVCADLLRWRKSRRDHGEEP